MKISFLIPAIVFYVVRVVFSNSVQVGTVLFTTTDLVKKCWTETDKSLLKARLIMQGRGNMAAITSPEAPPPTRRGRREDNLKNSRTLMTFSDVLPDPSCIDFSNPEAAVILLDYIHACYQVISKSSYGKVQNLMYLALSDAIGGYLRAYVLPFTKKAYYAGELNYSDARKIFQLYDDIRIFLKTSGVGWTEPQKISYKKLRVKPFVITGGSLEACNQLYTIESEGKLHCINAPNKCFDEMELFKNPKESFREENSEGSARGKSFSKYKQKNYFTHENSSFHNKLTTVHNFYKRIKKVSKENEKKKLRRGIFNRKLDPLMAKRVIIPLPVLDDFGKPHSIAVPFRKQPLRNLGTQSSAFILEQYYIAVIKCFIARGNTRTDIRNFNSQFHSWIVSEVLPHLNDEEWYPAFGGVLRVMETIRKLGAEKTVEDSAMHDIAYMFGKGVDFDMAENPKLMGRERTRDVTRVEETDRFARRHYLIAIIVASLIWIFIFCTCAFYFQATRGSYLLYEGHSGGTVVSSNCSKRTNQKNEQKFINFEFLVKFFKRKETENEIYNCLIENEKEKNLETLFESKTKYIHSHVEKETEETNQKEEENKRKREKERLMMMMKGQGDVEMNQSKAFVHPLTFVFPPLKETGKEMRKEKIEEGGGEKGKGKGKGGGGGGGGGGEEVRMLWKKPSIIFRRSDSLKGFEEKSKDEYDWTMEEESKTTFLTSTDEFAESSSTSCSASVEDETKGYSTEKQSSSCCCSERCRHSTTSYTRSSFETQLEKKYSSETINSWEREKDKEKEQKRGNRSSRVYKCRKGNKDYKSYKSYKSYKEHKRNSTGKTSSESKEENGSFYSNSETDY